MIAGSDVLAKRGVRVIASDELDDTSLHEQLWIVIRAMADVGVDFDCSNFDDSDAEELYDRDRLLPSMERRLSEVR